MANGLDAEEGFLMLAAADLTPSLVGGQTVCFETASDICRGSGVVADRARVAQVLNKFEGLPWHKLAMKTRLDTYYGNRGLAASVEISSSDLAKFIKITESDIVTRILWSRSLDSTPVLVDEFLSVLLNRRDFGDYVANPKLVTDFNIAGQPAARQLRFSFNPAPAEEGPNTSTLKSPAPLFNTFSLAPQQAALDGLGLILTVQQGTGINTLDMLVQPKSPSGSTTPPESAPAAAPSLPTVQGTAQPAGTTRNPLSPITPPKPATAQLQPQAPREQSRFIGGGAFYRPEQGVKPFVQFQQSHLNLGSAVATLSGQFGGNGSAFGSGTGRVDYLWFKELHHRLSAELSGGTDFTQQRLIAGAPVDERRTGAFARLEYEAFGGNNDSHMTIGAEGRRTTVALSGETPTAPDLTIVSAVINVVYTTQNLVSAHPFHLSVEPSIQLGRAISGNGANYAVGAVRANLNQHLLETVLTTVDVSAGVQSATASTPLVEQPSLGASNTLRGFRADDVIGTSLWFLQPELWFDFSGAFGRTKVAAFAAKKLRLAGFVDVGGASGVVAPASGGVRWGPGLGLRFFQGPIALKLDWARGIGDGASGRGRGRFFLGVSTAQTF
jgi:hypothetical protein